jgi:sulfur relay (sulfurtransferase) complex TusBCD TusD component (DsrE family)
MDRSQTSNCVPSESTKQSMSKCQFYLPDLICFGPPTQNELTLNETALQFSAAEIKEILQNNQLFVHFEPVLNQEQLSAAISIQRAYRHYKSKHLKSQNVPESCCVESQETPVLRDTSSLMKKNSSNIDSNVVCIQKYIRSAIEQQRFHHKRSLITKLQTLCRQFLARRRIVVRQQEEARQWHTVEQKLFGPWTLTLAEEMESVNETTTTPQSQFSFLLQRFLEHNRRWERWAEVDMSQTIHIATLRVQIF